MTMKSPRWLIPNSVPYLTGQELRYVTEVVSSVAMQEDGSFSQKCMSLLREKTGSPVYLTPSGTAALELAFMALDLGDGDEVLVPSYTFVSCANALVQMRLTPVFVDIREDTLNINELLLESAISPRTRAILVVHYAGIAAEMDSIMDIARRHNLVVIEDAAQAVNSHYKGKHLGSIGDIGIFSFHQTKNFSCGQGGAIVVNRDDLVEGIEIHRLKGTDRGRFLRGEVDKYSWIDRGSNYLLSEIQAAFLIAQLEGMEQITAKRKAAYEYYLEKLEPLSQGRFSLPVIPAGCCPNYHIFYILTSGQYELEQLDVYCRERSIETATHFVPLHSALGGRRFGKVGGSLAVTERVGQSLLRLPLYTQITQEEQDRVIDCLKSYFLT